MTPEVTYSAQPLDMHLAMPSVWAPDADMWLHESGRWHSAKQIEHILTIFVLLKTWETLRFVVTFSAIVAMLLYLCKSERFFHGFSE